VKSTLQKLFRDESGFILSTELVLVATIVVIGMVVGLSEVQHAVVAELNDVADAIGSLNQSYTFSGFSKRDWGLCWPHARTFGSTFYDSFDDCDNNQCDLACDLPLAEGPKSAWVPGPGPGPWVGGGYGYGYGGGFGGAYAGSRDGRGCGRFVGRRRHVVGGSRRRKRQRGWSGLPARQSLCPGSSRRFGRHADGCSVCRGNALCPTVQRPAGAKPGGGHAAGGRPGRRTRPGREVINVS
jgi:Flp pilus assembly pilin Flp